MLSSGILDNMQWSTFLLLRKSLECKGDIRATHASTPKRRSFQKNEIGVTTTTMPNWRMEAGITV